MRKFLVSTSLSIFLLSPLLSGELSPAWAQNFPGYPPSYGFPNGGGGYSNSYNTGYGGPSGNPYANPYGNTNPYSTPTYTQQPSYAPTYTSPNPPSVSPSYGSQNAYGNSGNSYGNYGNSSGNYGSNGSSGYNNSSSYGDNNGFSNNGYNSNSSGGGYGSSSGYHPQSANQPQDYLGSGNIDEYAKYTEEGRKFFQAGQLTEAVSSFEKALAVAPEPSLPVIYNNLAVAYIKRGNNYHDKFKQNENALSDFRKAYFYLDAAWPDGMERKPLYEKNLEVVRENLKTAYQNLGINASDKTKHIDMAKQLRMQGRFPEAIAEYDQALKLDKNNASASKALGDLFTVVNLPEKAKKYYGITVSDEEKSGGKNPQTANDGSGLSADETLVALGNAQYKTGEIDKAVTNFDKALTINPQNSSALNMLEKIWLNEIKFNPNGVLGHANLGSVYQKKKMFPDAMQQYNAAEHFAEQDSSTSIDIKKMIRLNIGTLLQEEKRYAPAISAYQTVLKVDPRNVMAHYYIANALQESGNTDGAIQEYNTVLSIDPNNQAAQDKLLALVLQQTEPTRLAAGLKQYGDRFPNNATIQAQIGETFHQHKDLTNASLYYQRAIHIDPKMASTWANLGAVYQAQGKDEESADAFRKASALEPDNATFKNLVKGAASDEGYKAYQQAVQLQQQGKTKEAIVAFKKALVSQDTADVHAAYGISLQSDGRLDDAIVQYQQAITEDAKTPDYEYYLGTAYHQKKDLVKAKTAYEKALALKPDYKEPKDALASLKEQTASADLDKAISAYNDKNYITALSSVNQALTQNKEDAMAYYYQGLILDAQKKPSLAVQSYQKATQYKPDFTDAYYALGVALDTSNDSKAALKAYQKFLSLSGTNSDDFVKYAQDRVKTLSSASPPP